MLRYARQLTTWDMRLQDRTCSKISTPSIKLLATQCFKCVFSGVPCRFIREEIYYFLLSRQQRRQKMERKRLFRSHMERTRPVSLSLPCKKNVEDENPLRTKESSTRKDEMEVRRKRENQLERKTPGEYTTMGDWNSSWNWSLLLPAMFGLRSQKHWRMFAQNI